MMSFLNIFLGQLKFIAPYWLLGIFIGSLISVFGKEKIHKLFLVLQSKNFGIFGLVLAGLIGIISPLCMYGTIPIAASFSQKGVKDDWLAAFMMSSVLLNPQLLVYTAALGKTALFIRFASCLICGTAAGLLVHYFYKKKNFFNFSGFATSPSKDTDPRPLVKLLKNIWRNIKTTGGYFLAGVFLAALFLRFVPSETFINFMGQNQAFGVIMATIISIPLYVCGGGTIPLLSSWLQSGMSMGAAAAFMITGPATKITNLGAVKIVLGMKHFALYIVFVVIFSILTGLLVNLF